MATYCYVRENADGSVYYPPTIPKPRINDSLYDYVPLIIYFIVGRICAADGLLFYFLVCFAVTALFINETIHRFKLMRLEREHLESRYDGDFINLSNDINFSTKQVISFILTCSICFYLKNKVTISQSCSIGSILCVLMITFDLNRILSLDRCALTDSMFIERLNGMDYGSGMAYSYFHGYLKLVLPDLGYKAQNFRDLISIYEANHKVRFRVKKLFILMPQSALCRETLNDPELGIEESSSLPEKVISVAGVKDRVYKNSVYKILTDNASEKVYVCLEFATPLKTFYDVLHSSSRFAGVYKKHRKEIVARFYSTLKMILQENPNCNELCELIYYDDILPNGEYRNDIGNIVLERINDIM